MIRYIGRVFLLGSILGLAGCATPVSEHDRANLKTIAVVSGLDAEISFHTMGVLPVIQKESQAKTEAIDVAAAAESIVSDALSAKGYTRVDITGEFRAFARAAIASGDPRRDRMEALTRYADSFDAVVFIVPQNNRGLSGGETGYRGIEVIPSKLFGLKSFLINCNTGLFVFRTRDGQRIGVDVEAMSFREVKVDEWKETWEELSAADREKIVEALRVTMETALKPHIEKLL